MARGVSCAVYTGNWTPHVSSQGYGAKARGKVSGVLSSLLNFISDVLLLTVRIQLLSEPTSQALENSIGKNVLLRLKGGGGIRGILLGFDTHMNLVLDDAEEIFKDDAKKLGMIVVRGDNIILVSPAE